MALIPIVSCLLLFQRFQLIVCLLIVVIIVSCGYYICKYAIRCGDKSILGIRLHKDTALLTYRNLETKSMPITQISMAENWVLLCVADDSQKILLDQESVGIETYRAIRRQVKTFNKI